MSDEQDSYDEAARAVVETGNRMSDADPDADPRAIADGLLAGAVHWWLYANQPCGDPRCEDCAPICTAELRIAQLRQLLQEYAETSDYYHAPTDENVARA
jgi:hypothetical protein